MPENKNKSYKPEISFLNVLLCLIVVFIHVSSSPVTDSDKTTWQYAAVMIPWRLAAFATQGFIMLSAIKIFITRPEKIDYRKFYISRLLRVILPYVAWVVIYYVYFNYRGYFKFELPALLRYIAVGDLVSHFYFVIVIIQFYLLIPVWFSLVKKHNPTVIIPFALIIMMIFSKYLPNIIDIIVPDYYFSYADRILPSYLFYWIAGCYIGYYYDAFISYIKTHKFAVTLIFCVTGICDAVLSYLSFTGIKSIYWLEDVHILYCMSALCFFYMLAYMVAVNLNAVAAFVFTRLNKITYSIYLSHILVIFITDNQLSKAGITSISVTYGIRFIAAYFVTIAACLIFAAISKKLKRREIIFSERG
jgi:peptidoglycan/LPS O-acetylase OafA/YrhL